MKKKNIIKLKTVQGARTINPFKVCKGSQTREEAWHRLVELQSPKLVA